MRLAAQGHFQKIFLDARFKGFAHFRSHLKEPVGWTQSFDPLVGAFEVVILDPEGDALPGLFKTIEQGPAQKLLVQGGPEAFDLSQRHRMMGGRADVMDVFLLQFLLEPGLAPPGGILSAVVGQHFPGCFVSGHRSAENLQHVLASLAVKQAGPDYEPGIIIHESDQIGVAKPHLEGENIALPHLIRGGPFEEPGPDQVPARFGWRLDQPFFLELLPDRFGAGLHQKKPAQKLGDPFDPEGGVLLFEFDDFVPNRSGQPRGSSAGGFFQTFLPCHSIIAHPMTDSSIGHPQDAGHLTLGEAFLQVEFDRAQPLLK